MRYDWLPELAAFRDDVRAFVASRRSPELSREIEQSDRDGALGPLTRSVVAELEERGWTRISWPVEFGGQGKSLWYQFIVTQELRYGGIPYTRDNTASMVGPAIQRFGTEEQKRELLPKVWSGEIVCALGYSEPNAGTDLASLQTSAVRDGDDYVINGQKIWTSGAHRGTHVWLAARTNRDAPKHRGISIFMVPLTSPGITIRPIWIMSGHRTNEVFYDNVRVPARNLIGEENRGWYIMTNALDHERVTIGVNTYIDLVLLFEQYLSHLKQHAPDRLAEPTVRLRLAELKMDLHTLRALLLSCAAVVERGDTLTKEASMVKVWGTELRYRMSSLAMELLGRYGVQSAQSAALVPLGGKLDAVYRHSAQARFTGGTNEVQRNIIAQRGLGLPR